MVVRVVLLVDRFEEYLNGFLDALVRHPIKVGDNTNPLLHSIAINAILLGEGPKLGPPDKLILIIVEPAHEQLGMEIMLAPVAVQQFLVVLCAAHLERFRGRRGGWGRRQRHDLLTDVRDGD